MNEIQNNNNIEQQEMLQKSEEEKNYSTIVDNKIEHYNKWYTNLMKMKNG